TASTTRRASPTVSLRASPVSTGDLAGRRAGKASFWQWGRTYVGYFGTTCSRARRSAVVVRAPGSALHRAALAAALCEEGAGALRVPVLLLVPVRLGDRGGGAHDRRLSRDEG